MKNRSQRKALLLSALFLFPIAPRVSAAEEKPKDKVEPAPAAATGPSAACEVEISYTWQPLAENTDRQQGQAVEPVTTFYRRLRDSAASEQASRENLSKLIEQGIAEARNYCSSEKENQSSCVAVKLRNIGSDYSTYDFQVRRALLDSITADCRTKRGRCLKAQAGDISCTSVGMPTEEAAAKPEDKAAGAK